jgi:hypothetical protein
MELRLPRIATVRKGAPKPEKGPGRDLAYFRLDRADPAGGVRPAKRMR